MALAAGLFQVFRIDRRGGVAAWEDVVRAVTRGAVGHFGITVPRGEAVEGGLVGLHHALGEIEAPGEPDRGVALGARGLSDGSRIDRARRAFRAFNIVLPMAVRAGRGLQVARGEGRPVDTPFKPMHDRSVTFAASRWDVPLVDGRVGITRRQDSVRSVAVRAGCGFLRRPALHGLPVLALHEVAVGVGDPDARGAHERLVAVAGSAGIQ